MSLDPTDVYPRRNLPPEAENWGRHLENDTTLLKKATSSLRASLSALGRTLASSLQQLSNQLNDVSSQQEEIYYILNEQTELYGKLSEASVIITQDYDIASNTSGWLPQITVTPPDWAAGAVITASVRRNSGSTTREVIMPFYVDTSSISSPVVGGQTASVYVSGTSVSTYEPPSPVAEALNPGGSTIYIRPYRNVSVSGSGTVNVSAFYHIQYVEYVS